MPELQVWVQWLAWSDAGEGVSKGEPRLCVLRPTTLVRNLWTTALPALQSPPEHYSRLWFIRGGRFMHTDTRTVDSYGLRSGDTMYVMLRCKTLDISG